MVSHQVRLKLGWAGTETKSDQILDFPLEKSICSKLLIAFRVKTDQAGFQTDLSLGCADVSFYWLCHKETVVVVSHCSLFRSILRPLDRNLMSC